MIDFRTDVAPSDVVSTTAILARPFIEPDAARATSTPSGQILGCPGCVSLVMSNPFRYFNSSPEVIRLVVMMYVRYPLSLRNVEDLFAERGIDISDETFRFWWNRFG